MEINKKRPKEREFGLLWIINRLWAFLFFSRGLCRVVDECPAGHVYTRSSEEEAAAVAATVGVSVSCLPRDRVLAKDMCHCAFLISAGWWQQWNPPPPSPSDRIWLTSFALKRHFDDFLSELRIARPSVRPTKIWPTGIPPPPRWLSGTVDVYY